jgi:hypothetical protein
VDNVDKPGEIGDFARRFPCGFVDNPVDIVDE